MNKNCEIAVLHVITGLNIGGAERAITNLLTPQDGEKYCHIVLCLRGEGKFARDLRGAGIEVYCLNLSLRSISFATTWQFLKKIFRVKPKIVQGWMYHGNIVAYLMRMALFKRPSLLWNIRHSLNDIKREKFSTRLVINLNKILSGAPDQIIYNSKVSLVQHNKIGFYSNNGVVIYNGFDTALLKRSSEVGDKIRGHLDIAENQIVIGHLARYHPMKDHNLFFSAAVEVINQCSNVVFIAAGRGVVPDNPSLSQWVTAATPSGRLLLLGETDAVNDLYQAMNFLTVSSAWGEGFPNVLGEAMSFRVPCIATDVGESASIIADTGCVVPAGDKAKLVEAMLEFIGMSAEQRQYFGDLARRRVIDKFSIELMKREYDELYSRLDS